MTTADLSAFGLSPAKPGAPTDPGANPPPVVLAGGNTPSPSDDSGAWITIVLGVFQWPVVRGQGTAIVKVDSSQKLDEQKAAGTDKAKLKQAGVDPVKGTIDINFLRSAWPDASLFLASVDPNNAAHGGPFETSGHPDFDMRGVTSLIVEKRGPVEWQPGGGIGKCTLTVSEWVPPAVAGAGGGKGVLTPKQAQEVQTINVLASIAQANADVSRAVHFATGGTENGGGVNGASLNGADGPNSNAP